MRGFVVVMWIGAALPGVVGAQDTIVKPESSVVAPTPPPPPTPAQARYLQGLRTASRGVAQLKDGVERVIRSRGSADTTRVRQAGGRLAGLCSAARGFMANGRAQMQANAYEDSTRLKARQLAVQIDSLIRYMPTCETRGRHTPDKVATEMLERLRSYEATLRDFRTAIGLPNRAQP